MCFETGSGPLFELVVCFFVFCDPFLRGQWALGHLGKVGRTRQDQPHKVAMSSILHHGPRRWRDRLRIPRFQELLDQTRAMSLPQHPMCQSCQPAGLWLCPPRLRTCHHGEPIPPHQTPGTTSICPDAAKRRKISSHHIRRPA